MQLANTLRRAEPGRHTNVSDTANDPVAERVRALTQAWRDATREARASGSRSSSGDEVDAASRPCSCLESVAYDKVFAQMQPLIGDSAAHDSACQTAKLVTVAQRIDELDTLIEAKGRASLPASTIEQRNDITAALVNHDVYFDRSVPQILPTRVRRISVHDDNGPKQSGFFGALYEDKLCERFLAADRGTEMGITGRAFVDWKHNIRQALGLRSKQYEEAINWAKSLARHYPPQQLVFTGHSLGGGLASAQTSVVRHSTAVTFDTAGLHNSTVARHAAVPAWSRVKAYYVEGELLSVIQEMLRSSLSVATRIPLIGHAVSWAARIMIPRPIGTRIALPPAKPPQMAAARHRGRHASHETPAAPKTTGIRGAIARHSMLQMIYSLFDGLPSVARLTRAASPAR
ncbi:lipase family protein [Pandoraea aquatica]|uniref:lipase family protein n=1 Tax=Pandoraea aquatica TaxID=2508290 RepID=UPI00158365F4|nr:Mbeg1-like protein [Pandoraea aquatica]